MLEKSSKKAYFDAHFHYNFAKSTPETKDKYVIRGCTCAHSENEWIYQLKAKQNGENLKLSYGIHPQSVANIDLEKNMTYLEKLADENQLDAIGEAGFDFFTEDLKKSAKIQEEIFVFELEMAQKNNLPVVIHCRKANEKLFEYSKLLKKVPAVLFHSFMGMPDEALSLQKHGINAFFSFGKQIFNANKKVIACVKELPLNMLMLETDAPFQTLKGEDETFCSEIERIYTGAFELRQKESSMEEFIANIEQNVKRFFN